MLMAALFLIAKRWKQLKYPSIDEWINKIQYIHKIRYYSAIKRNEVLTHATTWVSFANIILRSKSQTLHIV